MNLYEAMFVRKSVRNYNMEALEEKLLENITSYIEQLKPYKSSIEYEIIIVDNTKEDEKFKGLFQVKAPYYLLISSELKQDYLINSGFLMQQMILYLTARGIATCYQGGIKPSSELKSKLKYDYVIAIAFGNSDKSIYRSPEKAKRLSEDSIIVYKEDVSENMKVIMQSAILSPSSMNNQPWRFVVYRNRIHVFCKKARFLKSVVSDMKLIDTGIALADIVQAADELWLDSILAKSEVFSNKDLKNTEYITTVMLKEKVF